MILGRFLLRFLVVPLGASLACLAAMLFVIIAHWNRLSVMVSDQAGGDEDQLFAIFLFGMAQISMLSIATAATLVPGLIGVLIAEAFAIRSWIFHIANGALSSWVGWYTSGAMDRAIDFYQDPLIVVGAGIAAGFIYWIVAGWSAGFWKPVFAQPVQEALPPPQAQNQRKS
jgi:hypothetical protein